MIIGIGVDTVDVERIEKKRTNESFLKIAFTENEILYCKDKANAAEHFAVRFAAKEAFLKALGTGLIGDLDFRQIEIINNVDGKPIFHLYSTALEKANEIGATKYHLSLSHEKKHAIAFVILES
jgi:holo-[acyl-carrier protein] synthase